MSKTMLDAVLGFLRHAATGVGLLIVAGGQATQEETNAAIEATNSLLDSVPSLVGFCVIIVGYGASVWDKARRNK